MFLLVTQFRNWVLLSGLACLPSNNGNGLSLTMLLPILSKLLCILILILILMVSALFSVFGCMPIGECKGWGGGGVLRERFPRGRAHTPTCPWVKASCHHCLSSERVSHQMRNNSSSHWANTDVI